MNVKEAMEIVADCPDKAECDGDCGNCFVASAFLSGHESCKKDIEEKFKLVVEALKNIISIANSFGENPMPQSTYLCAEEAQKGFESYRQTVEGY